MKEQNNDKNIININIADTTNILSPFSGEKPVISSELVEFLEYKLTPQIIKKGIHLVIHCKDIEQQEQILYKQAIKNYYEDLYFTKKREVKNKTIISLILLMIGIMVITITIALEMSGKDMIKTRIYDIMAWVFVWEAVDIFFFQRPKINFERRKCLKMLKATIEYQNN